MGTPELTRVDSHTVHYKYASLLDLYSLGLTIVLGGQVFSWNAGLHAGFWEYFTSIVFIGTAYIVLVLCLAEMTSALPFSGGCYGFVRVAVGPLWGFVVACCEVMQNLLYVTASVIPFGEMMSIAFDVDERYDPLWWLFFFVTACAIHIYGRKLFWRINLVMGLGSLLLILVFVFGSIHFEDFNENASPRSDRRHFSSYGFFKNMPFSTWFYIGVEMLPIAAIDALEVSLIYNV